MKCYEETLDKLNQAIAQNSGDTWSIAHRGEIYCSRKQYEEALTDFSRAIQMNPSYVWAIAHRGETYRLMKHYSEAITDFNQAIELKPEQPWAIAHRGATYRFMGKQSYEQALADFNQAIELKPDYAWAFAYRCRLYELMKYYKASLIDFDRTIALDETIFGDWRSERGLLLNYGGQYEETIVFCEETLQENSDNAIALYCIAVAKASWKGLTVAKEAIEKARLALLSGLNTELRGDALYRLSGLAALEGNFQQALNYLQQAIPLNDEALELVEHDPAWLNWRDEPHIQSLLATTIIKLS